MSAHNGIDLVVSVGRPELKFRRNNNRYDRRAVLVDPPTGWKIRVRRVNIRGKAAGPFGWCANIIGPDGYYHPVPDAMSFGGIVEVVADIHERISVGDVH